MLQVLGFLDVIKFYVTCCGICRIPLVNFWILALVQFPPIGATSAAVRPAPRLLA